MGIKRKDSDTAVVEDLQPTSQPAQSGVPCIVHECPDGTLDVQFQIDKVTAERIKRRSYSMSLDRYVWENIIKRAVIGHVY